MRRLIGLALACFPDLEELQLADCRRISAVFIVGRYRNGGLMTRGSA